VAPKNNGEVRGFEVNLSFTTDPAKPGSGVFAGGLVVSPSQVRLMGSVPSGARKTAGWAEGIEGVGLIAEALKPGPQVFQEMMQADPVRLEYRFDRDKAEAVCDTRRRAFAFKLPDGTWIQAWPRNRSRDFPRMLRSLQAYLGERLQMMGGRGMKVRVPFPLWLAVALVVAGLLYKLARHWL
jgi:hypothetical protein